MKPLKSYLEVVRFSSVLRQLEQIEGETKEVKLIDLCHRGGEKKLLPTGRKNNSVHDCPRKTPQGEINNKNIFTLSYILSAHKSKKRSNIGLFKLPSDNIAGGHVFYRLCLSYKYKKN